MKVLYFSYWGFSDTLTVSTVDPNIAMLNDHPDVSRVWFCTLERNGLPNTSRIRLPKVECWLMHSSVSLPGPLRYFADFLRLSSQLDQLIRIHQVDFCIYRGATAGSIGSLVYQKNKVPYIVESFEPHADYMLEADIWNRWGIKYQLQHYWEEKQKKQASFLLPVAENYRQQLIKEGLPAEQVITAPCCIRLGQFACSQAGRKAIRQQLGLGDAITAIYVGKFGGVYYDEEAFFIFRQAFDQFPGMKMILLTPEPAQLVVNKLKNAGISPEQVFIRFIQHHEVSDYLSAADFAFSTIRPSPSRKYCSAIKNGEYWANGLPIVLTTGVGDDDRILVEAKAGAVYDLSASRNLQPQFAMIRSILADPHHREWITQLAALHRDFNLIQKAYNQIIAYFAARQKIDFK